MRRIQFIHNLIGGGCSFYRGVIFSGLSDAVMSPVPYLLARLWLLLLLHLIPSGATPGPTVPLKNNACCLLDSDSLALLKRNFCKKPKNPV
jgi:hypothetical protein